MSDSEERQIGHHMKPHPAEVPAGASSENLSIISVVLSALFPFFRLLSAPDSVSPNLIKESSADLDGIPVFNGHLETLSPVRAGQP
jgi:hypothetical protein